MHALPIKPRHIVVRSEHEPTVADHPPHVSPKHPVTMAHQRGTSPPKGANTPLETHKVDVTAEEEASLGSHKLPQADLQRIHSVKQHPVQVDDEDED